MHMGLFWHKNATLPPHRGAFCQFPFRWIYYCHSTKSTGKTHLCAVSRLPLAKRVFFSLSEHVVRQQWLSNFGDKLFAFYYSYLC